MNFLEIANARQSCRAYDETRAVEDETWFCNLAVVYLRQILI